MGIFSKTSSTTGLNVPTGIRIQRSLYGATIPVWYGRTKGQPLLVAAWNFSKQAASQGKKAGKASKKTGQQSYIYFEDVDLLLGYGPMEGITGATIEQQYYWEADLKFDFAGSGTQTFALPATATLGGNPVYFNLVVGVLIDTHVNATVNDYGSPNYPTPINYVGLATTQPLHNNYGPAPNAGAWSNSGEPYATFNTHSGDLGVTVHAAGSYTAHIYAAYNTNGWSQDLGANVTNVLSALQATWEPALGTSCAGSNQPVLADFSGLAILPAPLGGGAALHNYNLVCKGLYGLNRHGDCNLADIIADLICSGNSATGTVWNHGLNMTSKTPFSRWGGILADEPFAAAGNAGVNALRSYCQAYGIYGSLMLDTQQTADSFLSDLLAITNTAAVFDGFQLQLLPYCEISVVGDGLLYTAPSAVGPRFTLTDDHYVTKAGESPVTIKRARPSDNYNAIKVDYTQRHSEGPPPFDAIKNAPVYIPGTLTISDQGDIWQQGSLPAKSVTYRWLHDPTVVAKVAWAQLKRHQLCERTTYTFTLQPQFCLLHPMDIVLVTEPAWAFSPFPVRITKITEKPDFSLDVEAEPFIYGANAPILPKFSGVPSGGVTGGGTGTSPGCMNPPIIFEPVASLSDNPEIWILASGSSPDYGGCGVWLSTDGGSSYAHEGVIFGQSVMGYVSGTNSGGWAGWTVTMSVPSGSVQGGNSLVFTLTLNQPAISGANTFNLSSSDPSLTVPATATIIVGATSTTFTATTSAVGSNVSATVTADWIAGGGPQATVQLVITVTNGSSATEDMLNWVSMDSRRTTSHLTGTANSLYSYLDPSNHRFWWLKGSSGHPWDIRPYDGTNIYWWITEKTWTNSSSYKKYVNPVPLMPRYFAPGDTVTIDTAGPNTVIPTDACETDGLTHITIGDIRGVTSGPFSDIDFGGNVGNSPYIKVEYFYSGSGGVYGDRERYFLVKNWGLVRWDHYSLVGGIYEFVQQSDFHTLTSGSASPSFPCGLPSYSLSPNSGSGSGGSGGGGGLSSSASGSGAGGAYPSHTDPDTVDTLSVDLTESFGTLASFSAGQRDLFESLCYLEGGGTVVINGNNVDIPYELIAYQAANLTAANQYDCPPTIRRGVYSTPIVSHASGSQFGFIEGGAMFKIPLDPLWIGTTLYFKFTPFNTAGGGELLLSDPCTGPFTFVPTGQPSAPTDTYVIAGMLNCLVNSLQVVVRHVFYTPTEFGNGLIPSQAWVDTPPTSTQTFSVQRLPNGSFTGTQFGTVTFSPGSNIGTLTGTLTDFAIGDVLEVIGPAVPDTTAAGLAFTFVGTRSFTPNMTALNIIPSTTTVPNGSSQQFFADALYFDGSIRDVTSQCTFTSSNHAVATMSVNIANAVGVGTSTITATLGSISSAATMTVT